MKKFGTPSGAGPGVDSEKVGFWGVGLPSGLVFRSGDGECRSRDVVCRGSPLVTREAGVSDPSTGAPVEGRPLGWPDGPEGAGEDAAGGDGGGGWEGSRLRPRAARRVAASASPACWARGSAAGGAGRSAWAAARAS